MKLFPSFAAVVLAAHPCQTIAQAPGPDFAGIPGLDPLVPLAQEAAEDGDEPEGPVTLSIMEEVFSLSITDADNLLHDIPSDRLRYARLREMLANGKVRLEKLVVLRTKSGQRAITESIHELRYQTEFEPPRIPAAVPPVPAAPAQPPAAEKAEKAPPPAEAGPVGAVPGGKPKVDFPVTPSNSIAFETRNIGDTLEVEPVLGPDGITVDLTLVPQTVRYLGERSFGGPEVLKQPIIETGKVTTAVSVRDGQPYFLGTVHPPLANGFPGQPKEQRVWLEFLTVNVIRFDRAERLSKGAAATLALAQKLMIPGLRFRETSVLEAVEFLQKRSMEIDPEKKGVHFVLEAPPDLLRNRTITIALSECGLMEAVREVAALAGLVIEPTDAGLLLRAAPEKP